MKAMILAAGRGTRLRPLTHEMPKPMFPLLGKPVLEYLLEHLAKHGFTDIMINVSHLADAIENYFGDGRRFGVNIGYSFEGRIENGENVGEPLGSAGGIKRIQDFGGFFDDTFLVVCGDAIIDADLTAALQQHRAANAQASVLIRQVARDQLPNYGVVVCDARGRVQSFQEKPKVEDAKSDKVNTGVYFFEPQIIERIPANQIWDIGAQLLPGLLQDGAAFQAIDLPFQWIDIGRISDYWRANQLLMQGEMPGVKMPGREVKENIWTGLNVNVDWAGADITGPVYIGANARIEAGCEIQGPAWISRGCHLQSGAVVRRGILFEYTLIREHGAVEDAVVFGRHCVDKDGRRIQGGNELDWVGDARG